MPRLKPPGPNDNERTYTGAEVREMLKDQEKLLKVCRVIRVTPRGEAQTLEILCLKYRPEGVTVEVEFGFIAKEYIRS
jgi:hypothetical protein